VDAGHRRRWSRGQEEKDQQTKGGQRTQDRQEGAAQGLPHLEEEGGSEEEGGFEEGRSQEESRREEEDGPEEEGRPQGLSRRNLREGGAPAGRTPAGPAPAAGGPVARRRDGGRGLDADAPELDELETELDSSEIELDSGDESEW
jgi:hypothetical protein